MPRMTMVFWPGHGADELTHGSAPTRSSMFCQRLLLDESVESAVTLCGTSCRFRAARGRDDEFLESGSARVLAANAG